MLIFTAFGGGWVWYGVMGENYLYMYFMEHFCERYGFILGCFGLAVCMIYLILDDTALGVLYIYISLHPE